MNAKASPRGLRGGEDRSRSVRDRDVSPAASMDGFTAFRDDPPHPGARARDAVDPFMNAAESRTREAIAMRRDAHPAGFGPRCQAGGGLLTMAIPLRPRCESIPRYP